jgi:hypothetical protein
LAALLGVTAAVVGAGGKWESRVFGEIPKGVWEPAKTCFWFSPGASSVLCKRPFFSLRRRRFWAVEKWES